jgi:MFS transporter, DHA1 family, multidrug resistance protein
MGKLKSTKLNVPLFILMANVFVSMLGVGLVNPILPKFITEFGASGKDMGYLVAAMGLTQFLFSPLGGELSDKYGRKKISIIGLAILALSQLIFSVGDELWMLYFSRLIGGIGIGFLIPANLAYVSDVTTEAERGRGMGLLSAAITLGFVISPGVGGYLAEYGIRVPFYVSTVVAGVATLISFLFLPEPLSKEQQLAARNITKERKSMIHQFKKSFKSSYIILLVLVFTMTFGLANFETVFGLYVDQKYHYTPQDISIVMTVGALVGVLIQSFFLDRLILLFGEKKLINLCFVFSAMTLILILFSGAFWYMLLINILFISFTSILRPAISTLISKKAGNEQGFASGMNNAYSSLGNIIGPSLAGVLFDVSYSIPFLFGAFILLGSFIMYVAWSKKKRDTTTKWASDQNI